MLFEEVMQRLIRGENLLKIADELGIGQNKFRDILKVAGFEYEGKRWFFRGNEADLKKSVRDYNQFSQRELVAMLKSSTNQYSNTNGNLNITKGNTAGNIEVTNSNKIRNSDITFGNTEGNTGGNTFTATEVKILRQLVKESERILALLSQEHKPPTGSSTGITELRQKIGQNVGGTIKKTFVIEEQIAKRLNTFADRTGFAKSDLLTVAVQMLLEKYDT
jgi:hypothetical protein